MKINKKEAELIIKGLDQLVYFMQDSIDERLLQKVRSGNIIEVEQIANEHNEQIVDIGLLKEKIAKEHKLKIEPVKQSNGTNFNSMDIPF